ncbi:MAG: metallopeptidase family protein [Candidatus Staskawiczbacteria bacterium]|jgi:predicted Zn-dependent protease with MMP-like domain
MTHEEFEKLVGEGISSIGEKFLARLKNVDVVIEDDPTPAQIEKLKLHDSILFGLYEGVPLIHRQSYGQVLPDKITIFKNSIEKACPEPAEGSILNRECIKKMVRDTVWHEIAHHFGMNEEQVRARERIRNNSSGSELMQD